MRNSTATTALEKIPKESLNASVASMGRQFSDATIALHEAIARKAGLAGTDHKYLNLLIDNGPMTAGELARLSRLTTGAVTGVIDRLEKQAFVQRQFVDNDRRKVIIVPNTVTINKVMGPHSLLLKKKITGLVAGFTDKEQKIIGKYMNDAIRIMQEVTATLLDEKA